MLGVLLFLLKYVDNIIKDEKDIDHIMEPMGDLFEEMYS